MIILFCCCKKNFKELQNYNLIHKLINLIAMKHINQNQNLSKSKITKDIIES